VCVCGVCGVCVWCVFMCGVCVYMWCVCDVCVVCVCVMCVCVCVFNVLCAFSWNKESSLCGKLQNKYGTACLHACEHAVPYLWYVQDSS